MDLKNLSVIRQSFANAVFTHKVQEVAAEVQGKKARGVVVTNILLVSVVLILLVLQAAIPAALWLSYVGAGVTVAEIIFLIVQLSFDYEQRAVLHKNSALKYMALRDNYRALIADVMNETLDIGAIVLKRDALQYQYQVVSDLAPQTGPFEYTEAQQRLNRRGDVSGEEFTWSDEEIDWFLPEELRLSKPRQS